VLAQRQNRHPSRRRFAQTQYGETAAGGLACVDPSPRVGRSALRNLGCDKGPRIETFGAVSMEVTCEALIGTTRLATDRLQSSVCCPRSTSPVPETSPRRVCMLNIWHEMWPATRRQSASSVSKGVRLSWLHPSPSSGPAVVSKRVKSTGTAPPCEFSLSVPDRPLMRPATFAPAVDSSVFTA